MDAQWAASSDPEWATGTAPGAGATVRAVAETSDANLAEMIRVLRRRWPVLAVCLILSIAAAVGYSLLQQQQYTASAQLLFRDPGFDQQLFGTSFFSPNQDPTQQAATNQHLVELPIVSQRTGRVLGLPPGLIADEVTTSQAGQANVAEV